MPTTPYPIVQDVLNTARVRLNDAIQTPTGAPTGQIGGEVINDNSIFTKQGVNAAWQRFQEALVAQNFSKLVKTRILSSAPVVATADPGVFCYIDWTGYFDGAVLQTGPVLPQDLTTPLRLKERVHGSTGMSAEFTPMEYVSNGIFGIPKQNRNYNWTWDDDKITIPGSTQVMDFELRYIQFLAPFDDVGSPITLYWYDNPVQIMRCEDAFAWYICSEFANSRGDLDGAAIDAKAEAATLKLIQRELQNDALRKEWVIPSIPPATGATPYDYVSTILNTVKTRLNSLNGAAADVLISNQPYMQQVFNTAYRKLQMFLANFGYSKFTKETILTGLAAKTSSDPAVQVSLDWNGYDNGTVVDTSIALPQDLIIPMFLWQRPTGSNAPFTQMVQWLDGMPNIQQTAWNQIWDWRNDTIYMVGANYPMDLRILFAYFLPDLAETGSPSTPWYEQQVPIVRCGDSLSAYVCAEIARARPDLEMDAAILTAEAEASAKLIYNRDARQKQRVNIRRLSRSGRLDGNAYGNGWGGW